MRDPIRVALANPLQLVSDPHSPFDVVGLRPLDTATQNHNDRRTALNEINALGLSVIDAHLVVARAHWLHPSGVAERKAVNACRDARPSLTIPQTCTHYIERGGFESFVRLSRVNHGLRNRGPMRAPSEPISSRSELSKSIVD